MLKKAPDLSARKTRADCGIGLNPFISLIADGAKDRLHEKIQHCAALNRAQSTFFMLINLKLLINPRSRSVGTLQLRAPAKKSYITATLYLLGHRNKNSCSLKRCPDNSFERFLCKHC